MACCSLRWPGSLVLASVTLVQLSCDPSGPSRGAPTASSSPSPPSASTSQSPAASSSSATSTKAGPFELGWDPKTGRGEIAQRYDDGAHARICLQCRFPGYTGGLLIGSYSGSGFEYRPREPLRGFESINVFCAQDESIWDRDASVEYAFGWSENFGSGPDGERLEYVHGKVHEAGPERLILSSRNRGGCYEIDKRLLWPRQARYLLIRTRIRNVCDQPIHFDFWTGDDPWLGKYRSSEGDVGYTDTALVRVETKVAPEAFRFGGVYDLGNTAAGEQEGRYSGAANFILPRPGQQHPDRIYFANRFAHDDSELQAGKPLDNKSMLALNLGWLDVTLAPREHLQIDLAWGLADSTGQATPPTTPSIPPEHWSRLDGPRSALSDLRFDRERIELRLTEQHLDVRGHYVLANDGDQERAGGIFYPFPIDDDHPKPDFVELDGKRLERFAPEGARWPVRLPARGTTSFDVFYRQRHRGKQATYIVTSTRSWGRPLKRAEFIVRYPKDLRNVTVSYPADDKREVADEIEYRFVKTDFLPTKDVVITWQ